MNAPVLKQTHIADKSSDQGEEEFDLASYLDLILDNRLLIATCATVITTLGILYALMATPVYEASILVQVEDSTNGAPNILGELAGAFDIKSAATAEIEILRSRYVVSRAVENAALDITVQPKYFPVFGRWIARNKNEVSDPGVFGWGGFVWGNERAEVKSLKVPKAFETEQFVLTITGKDTYHLAHETSDFAIDGHVGQPAIKQTSRGELEVLVGSLSGKRGAQFIITHFPKLDAIEDLQKALNIAERGKQSGVIGVSLEGEDADKTANILNQIGNEYIRQNVERKSAEAEKSLAFLEKQLPEMKATLEKAESKYNALRNSRGTVDLTEEAKTVLQQSVLSQTRLLELKQKRDELRTRYQDSNPLIQAVNQQIATLDSDMQTVNRKIHDLPLIEQDLLRLTRDVKVTTDLYTSLLNSAQQLRLVKASKVGNARLLDHALTPLHPIRPKRAIVIGIFAFIGLISGVVAAFVRKSLFVGVEDPYRIEQMLGVTVSAIVPFSDKQINLFSKVKAKEKTVSVLAVNDPSDTAIESLRSFRTALQFSMLGAKNNIVMITGPTPAVGKSFISVNFAAVLAFTGKRVLLIDADIRKGYLNNYFGINRDGGLSEAIAGTMQLKEVIRSEIVPGVDFIPTGVIPPSPAELLEHRNFAELLNAASAAYDIVIIDTAPVLAVADAIVVAPHVGTIFNVVRGEVSGLGEIEESIKRIEQGGGKIAGIVFNGMKPRIGKYGYGSKYGKYRYAQYKY